MIRIVTAWTLTASLLVGAASASQEDANEGGQDSAEPETAPVAEGGPAEDDDDAPVTRADLLPRNVERLARYDCLACHAPESELRSALDPTAAPTLKNVVERVDHDWLKAFIADPRSQRPDTAHPHELSKLAESSRDGLAEDIVHFLAAIASRDDVRGPDAPPRDLNPDVSDVATLERGRALYHRVGCVACHGARESVEDLEIPLVALGPPQGGAGDDESPPVPPGTLEPYDAPLRADLASKYRPSTLGKFLEDPLAIRPSGHCPSMSLRPDEARAIADYLLVESAQRADGSFDRQPGLLRVDYLVVPVADGGATFRKIDAAKPFRTSTSTTIDCEDPPRDDDFAIRYSGLLDVEVAGPATFHLTSDDGSRLLLDGEVVIDNGGNHAPQTREATIELEEGLYAIQVDFYEKGGGAELSLEWTRADGERGPIPAERFLHWPLVYGRLGSAGPHPKERPIKAERARIDRGRRGFARLGCAVCHTDVIGAEDPFGDTSPPLFEQLAGTRPEVLVCLRRGGRFDFEPEVAGELMATFSDPGIILDGLREPEAVARRTMTRRNCYGCHRREGIGGVHPEHMPYFEGDEEAELGDQGRFPPPLTAVGAKLRSDVLERAVAGDVDVRPYLYTRMPKYGSENVGPLAPILEALDRDAVTAPPVDEPFDCATGTVEAGRKLAGERGGLGCIQCHDFLGTPSLGVRAVDMGTMRDRLRFAWFRQLLIEPSSVDLASRMTNVWVDGKSPVEDIEGGDREAQIRALWCWLGERDRMAPPPGLDRGEWAFEVLPTERTRLVSVFMKGVSPSVLCVGTPVGVHFAFDREHGRLAKGWRGRFLNAKGTWYARAGALESPASDDVFDFAPGRAVVALPRLDAPWPSVDGLEQGASVAKRVLGGSTQFLGRTLEEDGAVTLRYVSGPFEVSETVRPSTVAIAGDDGSTAEERPGIERSFRITAPARGVGEPVIARVLVARQIERQKRGRYRSATGDGPWVVLDEASGQVARVVQARELTDPERTGAAAVDRPALDGRYRRQSQHRAREADGPPGDELRIPVMLAPSDDGSALVATFSWTIAW